MDLNELKEKALALKEENVKLHSEIKAKKAELAEITKRNFKEIVLPYIQDMNKFIQELNLQDFRIEVKRLLDNSEFLLSKECENYGVKLEFWEHRVYGIDCQLNYRDNYKKLSTEHWANLEKFFSSVESCNAFIKELNADYISILCRAVADYEKENPKLTEYLQYLAEKLKTSSCIEKREDGSIEITINGKTYIGTVKEV